jgi:hypothetical protein
MAEVKNDAWLDAKEGDDHDKSAKEVTGDKPAPKEENRGGNRHSMRYAPGQHPDAYR